MQRVVTSTRADRARAHTARRGDARHEVVGPQGVVAPGASGRARGVLGSTRGARFGVAMRAMLVSWCLLGGVTGCFDPQVGDKCETGAECNPGSGGICDVSTPEGYCTIARCTPGSCPSEAICVQFDTFTSFCMRACSSNDDCRDGMTCRKPEGFCYVAAPARPGT